MCPRPPHARPKQEDVSNRVRGQICLTLLTRPVGAISNPYVTAHMLFPVRPCLNITSSEVTLMRGARAELGTMLLPVHGRDSRRC